MWLMLVGGWLLELRRRLRSWLAACRCRTSAKARDCIRSSPGIRAVVRRGPSTPSPTTCLMRWWSRAPCPRRLDSIIGIADIYTVKAEYVKALEKLLLINPLSSNYSDIERQNYTNAVVESLEKLNKKNKKLAGRYLKIFQDRNVLPRGYKF